MKILYTNNINKVLEHLKNDKNDYFLFTEDTWDDFEYKTTFKVYIKKESSIYKNDMYIKILTENQKGISNTCSIFNNYLTDTSNFIVGIKDLTAKFKLISIFNDYELLKSIINDVNVFNNLLKKLNDILYLKQYYPKSNLLQITQNKGFNISLLREQSMKKSYFEGLHSISSPIEKDRSKHHFSLLLNLSKRKYKCNFNFCESTLPSRINVLIGKNGVGKTKILENIVTYMINPTLAKNVKTTKHPNFISNLIVFSYNVYDDFYIYRFHDNISIDYQYLGFRRFKNISDGLNILKMTDDEIYVSKFIGNIFNADMHYINSLVGQKREEVYRKVLKKIFFHCGTIKNDTIKNVFNKNLQMLNEVMLDVNNHDYLAFHSLMNIIKRDKERITYNEIQVFPLVVQNIKESIPTIQDIVLKQSTSNELESIQSIDYSHNDYEEKLYFTNQNQKEVFLSAGQKVYTNFIINLFAKIKKNSLILIDEPENTLHPNFEVGFIQILQKILNYYNSFAIIATHSSIITREIPKDYVNIIIENNDDIDIQKPLMKTFGANIGDITNYIFDDIFNDKTIYLEWLNRTIEQYIKDKKTFEDFYKDYKNVLSYDLISDADNIFEDYKDV